MEIYLALREKQGGIHRVRIKPLRNGDQLTASLNGEEIAVVSKPGRIRLEPLYLKEGLNTLLLFLTSPQNVPMIRISACSVTAFRRWQSNRSGRNMATLGKTSYLICSTPAAEARCSLWGCASATRDCPENTSTPWLQTTGTLPRGFVREAPRWINSLSMSAKTVFLPSRPTG